MIVAICHLAICNYVFLIETENFPLHDKGYNFQEYGGKPPHMAKTSFELKLKFTSFPKNS